MASSTAMSAPKATTATASVISRYFGRAPPTTMAVAPMNRYTRPVPRSGWVMMHRKGTSMMASALQYSLGRPERPP